MKKLFLIVAILLIPVLASAATFNLKATWTPNVEPDMKEYKLYRTDGTRTLLGTIQHPTNTYLFQATVPDLSQGTMSFVITASDISGNESGDSTSVPFPWDLKPPVVPVGFGIVKQ
jgi:hypothetical protein